MGPELVQIWMRFRSFRPPGFTAVLPLDFEHSGKIEFFLNRKIGLR